MNHTQQPLWLVNIIIFYYEGEKHMGNERERKHNFLQHKGNSNIKKPYTEGSKSTGRKIDYAAVFADIIRRGALPEETFIHTAEMTVIKIAMREIRKGKNMKG